MSWTKRSDGKTSEEKVKIEDAIACNDWNARKVGYGAAAKSFKEPDLRGKNWDLFIKLVNILTAERNVHAMEKGFEAVLAFVEYGSIVDDEVMENTLNSVVKKGLTDSKPRIRELANKICLVLFDRKKHELVTEMLLQGMDAKNIKQTFSCIRTLTNALIDYGPSYVNIPAVASKAVGLCQDKAMFKQDMKTLLTEIYMWTGSGGIDCYLDCLDASQRKAMEVEFTKVDQARTAQKASKSAVSYDRSRASLDSRPKSARPSTGLSQVKNIRPSSTSPAAKKANGRLSSPKSPTYHTGVTSQKVVERACGDRHRKRLQPNAVTDMKLDDIFVMMESKQWGERKEAVDALYNQINSNTTINYFDFGKMIKRLRVLILEDTNVVLVSSAIKCVTALGKSQNKEFKQHAPLMMTLLLEKFKDKKSIIIDATREAIGAIYSNYQFGGIARYVALSLMSSNPSVKAETALFIQRCFSNPTPALLKYSNWHPLVQGLISNLTFSDQSVRENAMNALGTMLKAIGMEQLTPYLSKIPKHQMTLILKYSCNVKVDYVQPPLQDISRDSDELCSTKDQEHIRPDEPPDLVHLHQDPTMQINVSDKVSNDRESGLLNQQTNNQNSQENRRNRSNSLNSSRERSDRKSLSPAGEQRLASFHGLINQLRESWRNVHSYQQPQPFQPEIQNSHERTEEKITRKLQELQGNVCKCLVEIRQLLPQFYDELNHSSSQSREEVIQSWNLRMGEMERLLKSTFLRSP